ncbi:MAG: disulfide bond formation protein DsbA [Robiginitomaculum sp.]|nr:MAG: disulfide bond formation protein DsbA [Robiginitomaculum sp.]
MTPIIDLYWSFRSPYSYLALKPTIALLNAWDVDIHIKIVLPLALRQPSFFDSRGPEWMGYLMRDVFRLAQMSNQTIASPNPDPVIMDVSTGTFAKEQPLVKRLSRLGILASDAGHGLAFLNEVSTLIWSGAKWDEGNALSDAIALAGLNLTSLEETWTHRP